MRPTDICHSIELRAPAPRAFPTHSRHFRSGDASWSLGLHAVNWGTERFTTFVIDRFGGSTFQHSLLRLVLHRLTTLFLRVTSVGVFFPRR
jgi:hypothetical protein